MLRERFRTGEKRGVRGEGTARDEVNLIGEFEAPQRNTSDENNIIYISLNIFWGKFMELDDRGDFPRPTPRLENTRDPTARNSYGLDASVLREHTYGPVGHISEIVHLRLREFVDLAPQTSVNEVFAAFETVSLEFRPAMTPMGTWVKGGVEGLLCPVKRDVASDLVFSTKLGAKEIVARSETGSGQELSRLVSEAIGTGVNEIVTNPKTLVRKRLSIFISANNSTHDR